MKFGMDMGLLKPRFYIACMHLTLKCHNHDMLGLRIEMCQNSRNHLGLELDTGKIDC